VTDDAIKLYFIDAAEAALVDAENYVAQKRKAKAQESIQTARYFAAKCNNNELRPDFEDRLNTVISQTY
jgi:GrpB-like predicted nucleotidyltransferase (UPF0157 family)